MVWNGWTLAVAKRTSMFENPAVEIQQLMSVIKQDITALSAAISDLQVLGATQNERVKSSKHSAEHLTMIVDTLKNRLMTMTKDFKDILTFHTEVHITWPISTMRWKANKKDIKDRSNQFMFQCLWVLGFGLLGSRVLNIWYHENVGTSFQVLWVFEAPDQQIPEALMLFRGYLFYALHRIWRFMRIEDRYFRHHLWKTKQIHLHSSSLFLLLILVQVPTQSPVAHLPHGPVTWCLQAHSYFTQGTCLKLMVINFSTCTELKLMRESICNLITSFRP